MSQLLKLIGLALLLKAVWSLFGSQAIDSGRFGAAEISRIAATVRAEDVVMYTTTSCGYCAQAREWLNRNHFAFTECNTDTSERCGRELMAYGGNGVPYLVVRGQHMRDGFDAVQFLSLLAAR
jgi:glutaredoxin